MKVAKEKKIDKCRNEEIARFLYYECKLNANDDDYIPFNEFKNIEYLAKGGFGEVHKATWTNHYNYHKMEYKDDVVLKRIHDSSDKIVDILKEVKKFINNINVNLLLLSLSENLITNLRSNYY